MSQIPGSNFVWMNGFREYNGFRLVVSISASLSRWHAASSSQQSEKHKIKIDVQVTSVVLTTYSGH